MQTSVAIALYTITTTHFNMDARLFCGIMASYGFQPTEFQPRAPNTKLPPPFDSGPPLGEGLADANALADRPTSRHNSQDGQAADAAPRQGGVAPPPAVNARAAKQAGRARVRRLEQAGEALIQERGAAQTLARNYPFLLQTADDLFLKDVAEMLEAYRGVVLKYEGLKAALAAEGVPG